MHGDSILFFDKSHRLLVLCILSKKPKNSERVPENIHTPTTEGIGNSGGVGGGQKARKIQRRGGVNG